jgi:hypothetical protein
VTQATAKVELMMVAEANGLTKAAVAEKTKAKAVEARSGDKYLEGLLLLA